MSQRSNSKKIMKDKSKNLNEDYTIATLGSHTALQILKGAKDEGFTTMVIVLSGREAFYHRFPFIDRIIEIPTYQDFFRLDSKLTKEYVILVPHGSFVAYLGLDGNKKIQTPYFGNKHVLDWEADRGKQMRWMQESGLCVPKKFRRADHIDQPVIVKSHGAEGGHGYFIAYTQQDFDRKIKQFAKKDFIVQEYIVGVPMYLHYFYSPLTKTVELMSIDRRYETNVDSLGRLPLRHQESIEITPSFVVVGNSPLAVRESLLPDAFTMADRLITASQKLIDSRGLYGPFCLETVVTPDQKFYVIEVSCRIVAGTNLFIKGSPYSDLLYDEPMSTGRRIAREIRTAISKGKLHQITD